MNIRPKTVRRLLILFAIFMVFSGGLALLILRSIRHQRAETAGLRVAALAAYQRKDYPAAVTLFHDYLTRSHTENSDAEAIFDYGKSRIEVPEQGNRQITEGIEQMQRYLDLQPSDPNDASHQLLKLYMQVRYNKEARTLAGKLLAKNPADVEALRAQVTALYNEHNLPAALAACQKLNAVDPENLGWQEQELKMMAELKQPIDQLVSHARQLLDKHPSDPRFHALMGVAYGFAGDAAGEAKSLEAAANLPPPDTESVLEILDLLDGVQRIDLSDRLLVAAMAKDNDPRLKRLAQQRLFEREQYATMAEQLKDVDPKSPSASSVLAAYRAMALYELRKRPEADAVLAGLASRHDEASTVWSDVLKARYAAIPPAPATLVKTYSSAIARDPGNPFFRFFLGDAHANLGETDEAIRNWTAAARLSRTWAMPLYRISRTLSQAGRYSAALRAARLLNRRAPEAPATQIAYAISAWGVLANNPKEVNGPNGDNLLKILQALRARMPEETDTLPVYVALLSRRGQRDKAIEVTKAALDANPPLPENVMGQLATVSDQEHLNLEDLILNRAQQAHGMTPAVAFARALALHNEGKNAEATQLVETLRQSHPNDPAWQIGEARYREAIGDPNAIQSWIAVGDANPNDVRVQNQVLSSPARASDRAFWKRSIDRMKALTGPDAQAWQIDQAQWTLSGQSTPQELETSITSLTKIAHDSPELVEVHRLLAQALLRTAKPENIARATTELTTAHEIQPDDFQITTELEPLLASQGMNDKAMALVDSVAREPSIPLDRRLWAAQVYSELGNVDAGIQLLGADDAAQAGPQRDALLASLYRRAGRTDDTEKLYLKLLDDPKAPAAALVSAADFFAIRHQPEQSAKFVDRLKKMNLNAGSLEVLQAHLSEVEGRPQEAIKTLTDASKAMPQVEQIWQELAGIYLRNGNLDEADKQTAAGLAAIPSAPNLTALRTQITRARSVDPGDVAPLLNTLSHNPRQTAADQTLKLLADSKAHNESPQQLLSGLTQLANQYTGFLPLQELVVQRYVAMRRFKEAADLASRSSEVAPNDPTPLKMLYAVQAAAGNWEAARSAAERWRKASMANPLEPDVNIALTYLRQANPDAEAALKQLQPYVAPDAPEGRKEAATPVYCRALLVAGRPDEAAAMLQPLIAKSPQWAAVWLDLATTGQSTLESASAWLKRLAPLIPSDSEGLKIALGAAWEQVGTRFDSADAHDAARDILQPVIAHSPAPANAWWYWAMVNQSLSNLPEADRAWQEYLKLSPNNPQALNNLAFVMLLEGGADRLPRAEELAGRAIAAAPGISTFYDTMGRIENQAGKPAEAIKNFRLALDKDPNDVEAMIGLADMLRAQPSGRQEAKSLLTRINAMVETGAPLAPSIRKQLDQVKTALSSSI